MPPSQSSPASNPARPFAVSAEDVAHLYDNGRGLQGASFEIEGGCAIAATGPNGSGKSTLLRLLSGLIRAHSGRLAIGDGTVEPIDLTRRGETGLACLDQGFYGSMSAIENLGFHARLRGMPNPTGSVRQAVAIVGLENLADARYETLSSGMRQRMRIALAVLCEPRLLLLDEPGSTLDDSGRAMVRSVVDATRARGGVVILATNDPAEASQCDRRLELPGR